MARARENTEEMQEEDEMSDWTWGDWSEYQFTLHLIHVALNHNELQVTDQMIHDTFNSWCYI